MPGRAFHPNKVHCEGDWASTIIAFDWGDVRRRFGGIGHADMRPGDDVPPPALALLRGQRLMRSRFWTFVEACDAARSPRAVRELLLASFRDMGVSTFLIVTHAPLEDLRSLGVLLHNWPARALDHLCAGEGPGGRNPLFDAAERTQEPFDWPSPAGRRATARKQPGAWFDQLRDLLGGGAGVSQALRSTIVSASCSITLADRPDAERVRLFMRMGNYAYHAVLALQRPRLTEPDQLTAREHELLYRATILGERPADVAQQLDIKISTVRTLRQKASTRLEAGSQEQSAWRMVETGQLFRAGRKSRPRAR